MTGSPAIEPRASWDAAEPIGPIQLEEVRFLIVHHTADATEHEADDVPALLRGIQAFHVQDRGWNDIAYNFLIDRYGRVWEGRAGSLEGPVAGDATGGNQGFTQLVSLIGDFTTEIPTEEAQAALIDTLAWLGDRYGVDTSPGSVVTFVSRGSNRWPEGTEVTTTPIAGHRDMSQTTCPGDAFYPLLAIAIGPLVYERVSAESTTTLPTNTTSTSATTTSMAETMPTTTIPPSTTAVVASAD